MLGPPKMRGIVVYPRLTRPYISHRRREIGGGTEPEAIAERERLGTPLESALFASDTVAALLRGGSASDPALPRQHLRCLPWRHACRTWKRRHPVGDGAPRLRVSMQALTNETRSV